MWWLPIVAGCGLPGVLRTPGSDVNFDSEFSDTDVEVETDIPDGSHCGDVIEGIDVSGWDPGMDWEAVAADQICFAYVKATEGVTFQSSEYDNQYEGAAAVGIYRGAYHFALPNVSDGAEQAEFFVENGGDWVDDGITLPGALDMEYNPYDGDDCYDLTESEMYAWVTDFNDRYEDLTGRLPTIYTSASWWNSCVGDDDFNGNPLWVAHYGADSPNVPNAWEDYTIWQYSSSGTVDGAPGETDLNVLGGDFADLVHLARGD